MFYILKILIKLTFVTQLFFRNFQDQNQDSTKKFITKKFFFIY